MKKKPRKETHNDDASKTDKKICIEQKKNLCYKIEHLVHLMETFLIKKTIEKMKRKFMFKTNYKPNKEQKTNSIEIL